MQGPIQRDNPTNKSLTQPTSPHLTIWLQQRQAHITSAHMSDVSGEEDTMVALNVAKRHLRAVMKQKLKTVPQESIVSQSTIPAGTP